MCIKIHLRDWSLNTGRGVDSKVGGGADLPNDMEHLSMDKRSMDILDNISPVAFHCKFIFGINRTQHKYTNGEVTV